MKTGTATARIAGVQFIVAAGAAVAVDALVRPVGDDADYLATFASQEGGE